MFDEFKKNIDEEISRDGFFRHYKLMVFFFFNRFDGEGRFEGKTYAKMRHYFARHLIYLLHRFSGDNLRDKTLLDIGGATGDFCSYISREAGVKCTNIDTDEDKISRANFQPSILCSGAEIKFADCSFDFVISRGVIEHVPSDKHTKFIQEAFRVLKPGGLGYLTSSPWFAPWAGHQLAPFHVFPVRFACLLANFFFGKNYHYSSYREADLSYLSFHGFRKMLLEAGFKILYVEDPITRLDFLVKLAILREVLVQHMAFVVQKPFVAKVTKIT